MHGNSLRDDLQRQIDAGQVVAIVGAGVSAGATKGQPVASWHGLLHHGVDHCLALPTSGLTEASAKALHAQIDSGDLDLMLAAAEVVARKLNAPSGGEWRIWLRETVGKLRAGQTEVIQALRDLGVKLATTNYDGLLEEVTGLAPVTWRNGAAVERVLRGDDEGILHLHGFWKDAESVVLGVRDYEKVLGNAPAQAMQRAMRYRNTLLFVGCGEGLGDPNFDALLRWSEGVFAGSEYRHFRLALEDEVGTLQARHPDEQRIFVLGYGPTHGDLAAFLRALRPAARPSAPGERPASPASAAALPPAPICFGRDEEIADLVETLLADRPEPTPILGPAGIGKSTITLVALNDPRAAERYGARRYFIRCDAVRTREAFAAAVAAALGLPVGPQVEAAVITELASAPAALAIDNAETPWEADTLRVEELLAQLAAVPGLALIASLRGASRPVGVRWRHPIQPRSLPLPDARNVFLAIAGAQFAGDPHLDRLLLALDGVPLAITLMANAAQGQPDLAETWQRWETERTRMLRRAGGTDRLLNIEASYEISIQGPRMTGEARRLLSILGFLPGGVARGDLEAVLPGHASAAAAVLRQVGLAFDEAGRLRLLAPLREYVQRARPPGRGDLQGAISHYLGLATSLGEKAGAEGGAEAIARLAPEIENLESVIVTSLEESGSRTAVEAAVNLAKFARFTGLGTPLPLERALLVADLEDVLAARCRFRLGTIAASRSDHETARIRYEEALSIFRSIGDVTGEATCIEYLGDVARARTDSDTARACYEEALPLYRRVGNTLGEAGCIFGLGDIGRRRADYQTANDRFEEALPLYRSAGATLGEANCIKGLGDIAFARRDDDTACSRYEQALPLYRRVGAILGEANCIKSLGNVALAHSEEGAARTHFEQALLLYRRLGSVLGEANCIFSLGDIAHEGADYEHARMRYEEALPLYRRVGDVLGEANCIRSLADLAVDRSDRETARSQYLLALALYERIPDFQSIGLTHADLARVASDETERGREVDAAMSTLRSIGRNDLVQELMEEFGGG